MAKVIDFERYQFESARQAAEERGLQYGLTIWEKTNVDIFTLVTWLETHMRRDCVLRVPWWQESEGTLYLADEVDVFVFRAEWEDRITIVKHFPVGQAAR